MPKWDMPQDLQSEEPVSVVRRPVSGFAMPHELEDRIPFRSPEEQTLSGMPSAQQFAVGLGERLLRAGRGAKQKTGMLGNMLGIENKLAEEAAETNIAEAPYREAIARSTPASIGGIGAEIALGSIIPGATLPRMMASGAATEGLFNTLSEPTGANLLTEAGKGAAIGGIGGAATHLGLSAVAKGKNAIQGRFANPEFGRRFGIFKEHGVPGSLGDITQNPFIMSMENTAQHIPMTGRKDFLEGQAKAVIDTIDKSPKAIAGAVPSATKEDLGKVLADSMKAKYGANRAEARGLYDAVAQRVRQVNAPPVNAVELSAAAKTLLSKYPSAFAKLTDDPAVVDSIKAVASGTQPGKSVLLNAAGLPIAKPPKLSFDDLRALDSDLGSLIRQGRTLTAKGEFNNKAFDQLVALQKALRKDIDIWAVSVGDPAIATGIKEANSFFRQNVMPFRQNKTARQVLQNEQFDTDTLPGLLFRPDSPTRAEQALSFLTPEGRQAGRYYMADRARKQAMDDVLEANYSPSKFLKSSQLGETGPKLFSPDELGRLEDTRELVKSSRRAASYAYDPATGNRLLSLAPLAGMKLPILAKLFAVTSQSENPIKYMLASPRFAKSPLGSASENILRKSGVGLGTGNLITDELEQ